MKYVPLKASLCYCTLVTYVTLSVYSVVCRLLNPFSYQSFIQSRYIQSSPNALTNSDA